MRVLHVERGERRVVLAVQRRIEGDDVRAARSEFRVAGEEGGGREDQHLRGVAVAQDFQREIAVVLLCVRVAGDEEAHRCFAVYQRFRPVAEAEGGFRHRRDFARGHFEDFQRTFAGRTVERVAAEVDDAVTGGERIQRG